MNPKRAARLLSLLLAGSLAVPLFAADLQWTPSVPYRDITLTLSGSDGSYLRRQVQAGELSYLVSQLPDGEYKYELVATPVVPDHVRAELMSARERGDVTATRRAVAQGLLPSRDQVSHSGSFRVRGGAIVRGGREAR